MGGSVSREKHCYSARLIQSFARTLARYPNTPTQWIDAMRSLDPDERIPIDKANEMLAIAIKVSGDPSLPLQAGRAAEPGDAGALDYVMRSAATVHEAFVAAGRYIRLVNDALRLEVTTEDDHACVKMISTVAQPPEVEEFGLSSFFTNCVQPLLGNPPNLEIWFMRSAPLDRSEHGRTFAGASIRFGAPWSGFRFAATCLQQPVPTADPNLNQILRAHLDRNLAELPAPHSVVDRARHLIRRELPRGRATAPTIAQGLGMSRRTMCRRLEAEHKSFTELLDDVRRELALEHVGQGTLALSEIAFLLDFAQVAGFHRAFKRWTGETPLEYRARHR